jgi:hypothetical protein
MEKSHFTLKIEKGPLFILETPNLESQVKPSAALEKIAGEARGETGHRRKHHFASP